MADRPPGIKNDPAVTPGRPIATSPPSRREVTHRVIHRVAGGDDIDRQRAAVLAVSDERDLQLRLRLAAWREGYGRGLERGRSEHVAAADAAHAAMRSPLDPETVDAINQAAARRHAAAEAARWGPGGRAHFGDPRPGEYAGAPVDFYGGRRS